MELRRSRAMGRIRRFIRHICESGWLKDAGETYWYCHRGCPSPERLLRSKKMPMKLKMRLYKTLDSFVEWCYEGMK